MNKRFTRLGRRIDARFAAVDARFAAVDARFVSIESRLDASDARMRAGFESLHDKIDSLSRTIADHHRQYTMLHDLYENRLQDLEQGRPT